MTSALQVPESEGSAICVDRVIAPLDGLWGGMAEHRMGRLRDSDKVSGIKVKTIQVYHLIPVYWMGLAHAE